MSHRKSVLAEACNSSICLRASANSARSRRIVSLASSAAAALGRLLALVATLPATPPFPRRLASFDASAVVFFFIKRPERLAGIHQDRIVHSLSPAPPLAHT